MSEELLEIKFEEAVEAMEQTKFDAKCSVVAPCDMDEHTAEKYAKAFKKLTKVFTKFFGGTLEEVVGCAVPPGDTPTDPNTNPTQYIR